MQRIYLDHNAAIPPVHQAVEALRAVATSGWGNPSSAHREGQAARAHLELAREQVAGLVSVVDMILVMTVEPGFGGQSFMPEVMPKIEEAVSYRSKHGLDYHLEVDGGIGIETAPIAIAAGANVLVAGSSTFNALNMKEAVAAIRKS